MTKGQIRSDTLTNGKAINDFIMILMKQTNKYLSRIPVTNQNRVERKITICINCNQN